MSLKPSGDEWLIHWPERKYKELLAGDVEMQTLQEVGSDNFEEDPENNGEYQTSSWLHRASKISILCSPTNAHSQFIKTIKIIEYYSNMFRFTQKPSSGSQSVLAKITCVVHWLHN